MFNSLWKDFKRKLLPSVIATFGKYGMRLILKTCKIEVIGLNHFESSASKNPCILMLWHNCLSAIPEVMYHYAPQFIYAAFISKSRDGEPLARLALSYKFGRVLRVGHHARHHALNQMIQRLKLRQEIMLITPDGPRGPRYEIKPGIVAAARQSHADIIPLSWQSSKTWHLKTWDAMMIPKPFSKIKVIFGKPIFLTDDPNRSLEEDQRVLKAALVHCFINPSK